MSPRSDIFDIAADYYAAGPETHILDETLSKIMPQDMVPLYPESSFAIQSHDFVHTPQGLLDFGYETQSYETQSQWMIDSVLTACPPLDVDPYITQFSDDATSTSIGLLNSSAPSSLLVAARETSPVDRSPKVGPVEAELQHYCKRYGCFLLSFWHPATDTVPSISISHRVSITRAYRSPLNLDIRREDTDPDPSDTGMRRPICQDPSSEGLCLSGASQYS